ncbi:hypothetical protein N0Y54_36500 [Nostoc punctiforme UO1]|uniref:hypothetical protein n=1 Tax=Nostoc punctiforme TaxID=272131 RepID=UPI0030A1AA67
MEQASHGKTKEHFLHPKSKLVYCDRNFLTPSIQSTVEHLSPIEQICQGKRIQTPVSRRDAHHSCPKYCLSPPTAMALFRPLSCDRQPQAEAKNAFKNLKLGKLRA